MTAEILEGKTKVIATLGPSSSTKEIIEKLIRNGVDIFRLNFSHGTHEEHKERLDNVRKISQIYGKPVAVIQDLGGPKIRLGKVKEQKLCIGEVVELGSADFPISIPSIIMDLKPDDLVSIDDGRVMLKVRQNIGNSCFCEVIREGVVSANKGVNIRSKGLSLKSLTEKDLKDLEFAVKEDIDYVALSFVKSASDIDDLRKELKKRGKNLPVIAKIEKHEALENLEEIIDRADAILIARGDLGVEISLEEVPLAQIKIIKKCRLKGKPVIVATQIMESMVNNPFPTRAEVNDIATAIIQGTDSIMFSSETAVGLYPVEVISTVNQVILKTEAEMEKPSIPSNYIFEKAEDNPLLALSYSACLLADNLKAQAMIIPTETGKSAKRIARFRPFTRIIALTTKEAVSRQLCLVWGVLPIILTPASSVEDLYHKAEDLLIAKNLINIGDKVIFTSGAYVGLTGGTNTIKYHIVGDAH